MRMRGVCVLLSGERWGRIVAQLLMFLIIEAATRINKYEFRAVFKRSVISCVWFKKKTFDWLHSRLYRCHTRLSFVSSHVTSRRYLFGICVRCKQVGQRQVHVLRNWRSQLVDQFTQVWCKKSCLFRCLDKRPSSAWNCDLSTGCISLALRIVKLVLRHMLKSHAE